MASLSFPDSPIECFGAATPGDAEGEVVGDGVAPQQAPDSSALDVAESDSDSSSSSSASSSDDPETIVWHSIG